MSAPAAANDQPHGGAKRPVQLVYIGSASGMEYDIVRRESDLPFRSLPAAAIRGRGGLARLRGMLVTLFGTIRALLLLHRLRPAAILGTGGYVCVPLFLAAWLRRVPSIIYLPDVVPGMAVQFLARFATRVACNVPDSQDYLPTQQARNLLVTGYPVRTELWQQDKTACRDAFGLHEGQPILLIYGGSRGARSINRAIEMLLPHLLDVAQVIHVCGREGDESWLWAAANRLSPQLRARYRLYPYLENVGEATMVRALGAADLALCRSGASTLAELPAAALPAVLVPYPHVHQDENADYLVRHGASIKVDDAAMIGDGRPQDGLLFQNLYRLLTNTRERHNMAQQSQSLARPDAAQRLAGALCGLATRSES